MVYGVWLCAVLIFSSLLPPSSSPPRSSPLLALLALLPSSPSVPLPLQTFTVSDTKGDSFGNKVKGRTIPGYGVVVVARAALEPHYEGYVSLPYVKPIIICK